MEGEAGDKLAPFRISVIKVKIWIVMDIPNGPI